MSAADSYQPLDFEKPGFAAQDEVNEALGAVVGNGQLGPKLSPEIFAAGIGRVAARQHAEWRQYDGAWNGPEWELVRFTEDVVTKGGLRFAEGDYTIADMTPRRMPFSMVGSPDTAAYSIRGAINCHVRVSSFEVVRIPL